MPIVDCLFELKKRKSSEMFLASNGEVYFKENNWEQATDRNIKNADTVKFITEFLLPESVSQLDEYGFFHGMIEVNQLGKFYLNVQRSKSGLVCYFADYRLPESSDLQLPLFLIESIKKQSKGLVHIGGTSNSGKHLSISKMIKHLSENKVLNCALFEKTTSEKTIEKNQMLTKFEIHLSDMSYFSTDFIDHYDVIIFNLGFDYNLAKLIQKSLLKNKLVILITDHYNSEYFLNDYLHSFDMSNRDFNKKILADYFVMSYSILETQSSDKASVYITEFLLKTPRIKQLMQAWDFESIINEMRIGGDSTGMMTYNQSLVQQLIRRKIDLKTAFELTLNVDELDILLKKVGI